MARKKTVKGETDRIIGMMQEAETYRPYYADSIDHLAKLYVMLEKAEEAYEADGDMAHGRTDPSGVNPLLLAQFKILDQCKHYEAKLGLTPADHKKMTDGKSTKKQESSLTAALRVLSG